MCGINGFNWSDKKLIKQINNTVKHRGPDDSGIFTDSAISLGHSRLSIIDLSKKGKQPMKRLNYIITFNGEIYNYKEIKRELKEYNFKSNSDTEVILYAYDKWKEECLKKLNGMFAFCIYDTKKKELFLARDRFGIKPLYYFNKNKRFAFCSEIKGLLNLLDKKEIDNDGLAQFFNFRFTLGETTLVKDIKKFLPGHYLLFDLKNKKIKKHARYYELQKQHIKNKNFAYYKKKTRELLDKSVKRRMVSDVPVACLLSGGIDSSIITALAKKYNPDLNTFSIGFDTTNELPSARLASNAIRTNHHEFKIDKNNILRYLNDMIYHMDEPIGDPGFLPIFVLSKEVKKHNKVVLSGDGGDEVFCGYDRYKMYHYGKYLKNAVFHDFGNDILKRFKKMKGKDSFNAFFEIIRLFDNTELKKLGISRFNGKKFWQNKYSAQVLNAQEFDINTLLPNDFFMKADKMSSAFGLEQRVPFLDHELVEFAFSIPFKYKLMLWNEKYILKEAFRGKLPRKIINRRKHGFDVPIDYWFKNVLAEKLKKLLKTNNHKLYKQEPVLHLLTKIKKTGKNYKLNFILAQKLWSILMFEMWYERFIK